MGSHVWEEQCRYCSFEEMIVSSYNNLYFEAVCPVCGYMRWTEERVPNNHNIKTAKRKLARMDDKEKQKVIELYYEDGIPLIARLKRT